MAYNPNLPTQQPYAPPTGNNVAGGGQGLPAFQAQGATGAMTSGSLQNAVTQQAANPKAAGADNPYAAASAAGAAMYSALKNESTSAPGATSELTQQDPNAPAPAPKPPPVGPPPAAPPPAGTRDGGRPVRPADTSDAGLTKDLMTNYGIKDAAGAMRLIQRSRDLAKNPGFEFLAANPQVYAAYEAEMLGNPTNKSTFAEWMARSGPALKSKWGIDMAPAAKQAGYDQWATRMRNTKGPKGEDVSWITPQHMQRYDEWSKSQPPDKQLDFWGWAGSVNAGKDATGAPLPTGGKPPIDYSVYGKRGSRTPAQIKMLVTDSNARPEDFLNHPEFQDQQSQIHLRSRMRQLGKGGASTAAGADPGGAGGAGGAGAAGEAGAGGAGAGGAGGAAGGGSWQSGPQGGYQGGNDYLESLKAAIGGQQSENLDKVMREFRHNAALGGMENTGAYGTMSNEVMRGALGDMNKQLNEVMFTGSENEQERALKQALAQISSGDSRYASDAQREAAKYGADASASAAGSSAQASMYGDDLRFQQGMAGLDMDKWKFSQSLPLDYWRLMKDWFGDTAGMPGPQGPPSPGIPNQT